MNLGQRIGQLVELHPLDIPAPVEPERAPAVEDASPRPVEHEAEPVSSDR